MTMGYAVILSQATPMEEREEEGGWGHIGQETGRNAQGVSKFY